VFRRSRAALESKRSHLRVHNKNLNGLSSYNFWIKPWQWFYKDRRIWHILNICSMRHSASAKLSAHSHQYLHRHIFCNDLFDFFAHFRTKQNKLYLTYWLQNISIRSSDN